jgi:hypothetical protein
MTALLDTSKTIVGLSGSGKTVTAKDEVRQLLDQRRHVAIVDPTGVWWGMRASPDGAEPGFELPIFGGEHGDVPIAPGAGAEVARVIVEQRVSAIVDLSSIDNSRDWRRFMADFVAELRKKPKGNFHLVLDEADEFAAERPVDDVGFALRENLVWVAKRGRVQGFVPTFITQRTAEIAKAVISQAQTIIAHQLIAPSDQKAIDDYLKGHGSADVRREVMSSLAELGVGERWIYSPRLKLLERGITPAPTTYDSSRTPEAGEQLIEPRTLAQLDVSAIAAALAPAEPAGKIPADAEAAYHAGGDVGTMLRERDERIAALEADNVGLRAALDLMRGIEVECDRYQDGLGALEQLLDAVRDGRSFKIEIFPDGGEERGGDHVDRSAERAGPYSAPSASAPGDSAAASGASETAPKARGQATDALAASPTGGAADLAPRHQRILGAIDWAAAYLKREAVPREIVAWIAETSATSGSYRNDLGALRSAGLIDYPTAGMLVLTDAGAEATPALTRPRTRKDLWAAIGPKLQPRHRAMIDALWNALPRSREALAAQLGISPTSGSFRNDLGHLRTLGLIDYPAPGQVVLAELLR